MIEWLWVHLVLQRADRLARGLRGGGFEYQDVMFVLTLLGFMLIALAWAVRKLGGKAAADAWEQDIRDTAALAERGQ